MDDDTYHRRFRQRTVFAREVSAQVDIDAPAELVWSVLADLGTYERWNRFTPRIRGELRPRARLELEVHGLAPWPIRQHEWINRLDAPRVLFWGVRFGHPAILVANREQRVEPLGAHRCRYFTADRFSGLLVPLVFAMFGRGMRRGFETVADGLKNRAEALATGEARP